MKKLYLTLLYTTFLLCCGFFAKGQTYHQVAHITGTQNIAGNNVTVIDNSSCNTFNTFGCVINSYWLHCGTNTTSDYTYNFSKPISDFRLKVGGLHSGEVIQIYINNVAYTISSSEVSYLGCAFDNAYTLQNGMLTSTTVSSTTSSGAQVDISNSTSTPITSIKIEDAVPGSGGYVYELYFVNDTCYQPFTAVANTPCGNGTLELSVDSIPHVSDYYWIKGATPFSTLARNQSIPDIKVADAGSYYVSATWGTCTYTSIVNVTVNTGPPPAPNTTINNGPLCPGSTLNLSTGNVSGTSGYQWNGPNNFTSALQNPTLTNISSLAEGKYYVRTISSTNGCLSEPDSTTLIMFFPTAPPVAGGNTLVCRGTTLNLTASSIGGATYTWAGPNNFTSNLQNPVRTNMTFTDSGDYYVTATSAGCTSIPDTVHVSVKVLTQTPYGASNSPVCPGSNITFNSVTIPNATYYWSGPNFTSSLQNPVLTNTKLSDAGSYYVIATVNGCVSDPDTVDVVVAISSATPEANSNSPVCPGKTLELKASTIPNSTYEWKGPGFTSTDQNPTRNNVTITAAGTYYLYSIVNGCKSLPDSIEVKIETSTPTPTIIGNTPLCRGESLNLLAPDIANASYSWTGPNNFNSTNQNITISKTTPADSGIYIVTASIDGCNSLPDSIVVAYKPMPDIISVFSNSPVCEGDSMHLQAKGYMHDEKVVYNWIGPANFTQGPSHIALVKEAAETNEGKYSVSATYDGCVSEPMSVDVVIKPKPVLPVISARSPVRIGDTVKVSVMSATPGVQFRWNCPDGVDRTDTSFIVYDASKEAEGEYIVTTMLDGCRNTAKIYIEISDKETFILYPSPNTGSFTIKVTLKKDREIPITVINPIGQVVYHDKGQTKGKLMIKTIDLGGNLANGIYLLRLGLEKGTRDMKFMIGR